MAEGAVEEGVKIGHRGLVSHTVGWVADVVRVSKMVRVNCMLGTVRTMKLISSVSSAFRMKFWAEIQQASRSAGLSCVLTLSVGLTLLAGCSHFRPKPAAQYVYVTAKQTMLRDRVAAVSNRTGTVGNGDRLEVLEHGRRFYRVKTEKGETGWIDEKAVATQDVYDQFEGLGETHKGDPAVASAVVRDEVNLHLKPGRQTERFYRLAEGDKLQLLERATLPKPVPGGAVSCEGWRCGQCLRPDCDGRLVAWP